MKRPLVKTWHLRDLSSRRCCKPNYRDKFATFASNNTQLLTFPSSDLNNAYRIGGCISREIEAASTWGDRTLSSPIFSASLSSERVMAAPVIRAFLQPHRSSSRANAIRPSVYRHANRIWTKSYNSSSSRYLMTTVECPGSSQSSPLLIFRGICFKL